jgi:hypothetical protein
MTFKMEEFKEVLEKKIIQDIKKTLSVDFIYFPDTFLKW